MNSRAEASALLMEAQQHPMGFPLDRLDHLEQPHQIEVLLALVEALHGTVEYLEKEAGLRHEESG